MTTSQEYFLIVAKSLNMTQSAKELFVSQQSLSYHIGQLEKQYNAQLFIRKPTLRLTQAGEHLLIRLEKLAKMERDIHAEMQDCDAAFPHGELIVGMHPSRFNLLAPLICPEFRKRAPNTRLKVLPGMTAQFENQLLRGELDAFIGVNPHSYPNVEIQNLLHETGYVAIPLWMWKDKYGHQAEEKKLLAEQEGVNLDEIIDLPFVDCLAESSQLQRYIENYVESRSLHWNHVITCADPFAYIAIEDDLQVSAILPQGHTLMLQRLNAKRDSQDKLLCFRLRDIGWEDNLCVAYCNDAYISKSLQIFLEVAKNAFQQT